MARPFPVAVRVATDEAPRPAISLEQRLESIALPLKKLAAADVARQFELPAHAQVLKTTLSLCPDCLEHITAAWGRQAQLQTFVERAPLIEVRFDDPALTAASEGDRASA